MYNKLSNVLCECVALAELLFCHLCAYFMEMSDYDENPLCNIVYFFRVTGLLPE